jgi:hypothetical protein
MSVVARNFTAGRWLAAGSLGLVLFGAACGDGGDAEFPGTGLADSGAPSLTPGTTGGTQTPVVQGPANPPPVANPPPTSGSQDAGAPPPVGAAGAWCNVKAALDRNCTNCHDGKGSHGSPFGLTTLADLKKESTQFPGKKIYERVGVRLHDTARPMPPQAEVSAADKAVLDAWIAAGAPGSESEMCATTVAPVVEDWPADCEEKYKLLANNGSGGKFSARTGQYYQDFMFTPPWKGDVQAVAFRAIVDNKKVLHHYILYQNSGAFLVGWSPGKNDHVLPKDVGVFLPATGQMKMTVHYYNVGTGAKAEPDASGVEICITKKKRPQTAAVMPFAANPIVPGNSTNVEIKSSCTVRSSAPATIITSSPHMHQLGVHAKFTIQRANGMTEVIHDKPFNFEEQTTHSIEVKVNNGDKITTTCIYKNPTSQSVSFGTNTQDEMCFNFALYYPMCGMTCDQEDPLALVWSATQGGGCPTAGGSGGGGGLGGIFGN